MFCLKKGRVSGLFYIATIPSLYDVKITFIYTQAPRYAALGQLTLISL